MRTTTISLNPLRRPRRSPVEDAATSEDRATAVHEPWSANRVLAESERVSRRLQQLEARPWWRVSRRELDEIDARLDVLRAQAAEAARG